MWFLPVLIIGAIVIAATNRSPRELPPPRSLPLGPAGPPGPISVLGEYARIGEVPPPPVILCAIAEAELLGRNDVAAEIIRVLIAPVVIEHQLSTGEAFVEQAQREQAQQVQAQRAQQAQQVQAQQAQIWRAALGQVADQGPLPTAGGRRGLWSSTVPREAFAARPTGDPFIDRVTQGIPMIPMHGVRAAAPSYERGSFKPVPQQYERGSSALPASPRALAARQAPAWVPPAAPAPRVAEPVARPRPQPQSIAVIPHVALPTSDEEIRAMINEDPRKFIALATGVVPAPSPSPHPVVVIDVDEHGVPSIPTTQAETLAEQLMQLPGFSAAGVTLVDPSSAEEIFEVRWLRGHPIPELPQMIAGRPVHVVIVDGHAVAQDAVQPMGLPPETVAQMQEAAGLHEAADQTRAMAPGSPIADVSDDAWRAFVGSLERESPLFESSRHVGQYRQRRERLAELGIDPHDLLESAQAQRAALDADLVDAYRHAAEGGLFAKHVGRPVVVPGMDEAVPITCSGVLGVIQCAGLDGATGWLERSGDRKRYPHTTQAFTRTNGVF